MEEKLLPKRKKVRLGNYDYSTAGAYFITVCVKGRKRILWENVGAATSRPEACPLSAAGKIVEQAILQVPNHYEQITVDQYCVMPDHIHMILRILGDEDGRQVAAPTISTVVGHMKRWVSIQLGESIWQKSFVDRVIRNEQGYLAVWEYIENNPIKMDFADEPIDFSRMQDGNHHLDGKPGVW